jgi:hypothetical protein
MIQSMWMIYNRSTNIMTPPVAQVNFAFNPGFSSAGNCSLHLSTSLPMHLVLV